MDINEIHNLWSADSKIDDLELDQESLKIPQLHSKYMRIFTVENTLFAKMTYTHKVLERDKAEYYSGKMCDEDLTERGWEPLSLKILKGDVPRYVEGDKDVVRHLIKMSEQKEKVSLLKSIIDSINSRSFIITNAIKWKKFISGEM
tara:strand:- start:106 stop:543 length:438 start_codon:yes stop_codon:yes gene_type:complete